MNFDQEISVNVKLTGSVDGKTQNIFFFDFCDQKIAVDIPNTISVGETLRLKGMGKTAPDGTRGDLYLRIQTIYKKSDLKNMYLSYKPRQQLLSFMQNPYQRL